MKNVEFPPIGVYEHYKSTPDNRKLYRVLGFTTHTETQEILAIYIPLYDVPVKPITDTQARPLDMFLETVEFEGKSIARFRYIGHELVDLGFADEENSAGAKISLGETTLHNAFEREQ